MLKTIKSAKSTLLTSVRKAHEHDEQARQLPTTTAVDIATKKWLVAISQRIKDKFGDRLRSLREKLTLSPEAVAHQTSIPLDVLGRIERGEEFPSVATAKRICEVLDATRRPKDGERTAG